jgi:hypothetical protein
MIAGAALKGLPGVLDRRRPVRLDPAGVPIVPDVAAEELRGRRHEDLESRLALAAHGALDLP